MIEQKLKQVEKILQEIEDVIKSEGFNVPEDLVRIPYKLSFPRGYFRKIKDIYERYKLYFFNDKTLARNIAYAIQYTDFLNYIFNRTNLGNNGLSIGSIFRKNAIISVVTVIEAYIAGMVEEVINECYECTKQAKCDSKIKKSIYKNKSLKKNLKKIYDKKRFVKFKEGIDFLLNAGLINKKFHNELDSLRNYRNHIHIQYIEKNGGNNRVRIRDFGKNRYNIKIYNNSINTLKKLPDVFKRLEEEFSICLFDKVKD
ncbi:MULTISPECIES: hypothetical protein [unclassified Thermosipho (in: thermotogales)]|uniref:hypothetical protein n=1 Tax=unclassified Thermosipho (in: thermotogales) TaxID=2676525 RepID=UPI0009841DE8|nr:MULTISPECIES: hypothetical protein [unclassified Thermosipho (in: thermotogales)]MBT1247341.1 hypothetical protein [Thermosipho sp. 1244]OOC46941.1 hypothetical protein XO09_04075 [Thermosipho sp. 1223]